MKHFFKTILMLTVAAGLIFSLAFAEGRSEKGKTLFNDPKLAGGTKSCSSCHPDGKGLENAGRMGKKEWKTPAGTFTSLEATINTCLTGAVKGKAIDPKSDNMKNLVAYIKSLYIGY